MTILPLDCLVVDASPSDGRIGIGLVQLHDHRTIAVQKWYRRGRGPAEAAAVNWIRQLQRAAGEPLSLLPIGNDCKHSGADFWIRRRTYPAGYADLLAGYARGRNAPAPWLLGLPCVFIELTGALP